MFVRSGIARHAIPYAILLLLLIAGYDLVLSIPGVIPQEEIRNANEVHIRKANEVHILAVSAVVLVPGMLLIFIIAADQFRRIEAKRRLSDELRFCGEAQLDWLRNAVESRLRSSISYAEIVDKSLNSVLYFLQHDRRGQIASDALFQRSRTGRRRYFDEVARRAREQRRMQEKPLT